MATSNDLKNGMVLNMEGQLWSVIEFQHVKPGKGPAFVRTKMRHVLSGKVVEKTFNAGVKIETATVDRRDMQYLYKDGDDYHFMHPETFEDVVLMADQVKDAKNYLIEGQKYTIQFADDVVIGIELPPSVVMTVAEAPEGVKGDSANNVYKAAIMETGLQVQVPLFIGPGDKISVKTEDNSYLGRSN
jgi:elongation factor P